MSRRTVIVVGLCCVVAWVGAHVLLGDQESVSWRFEAVDVYVDSKDVPLAAYQFEFTARTSNVAVVGVGRGEHPAFRDTPYFDSGSLPRNRIIVAAFDTGRYLPKGQTRVARVHLQVTGEQEPAYALELVVAATSDGTEIPATISLAPQGLWPPTRPRSPAR